MGLKGFAQETVINGVALYIGTILFAGLTISGEFWSYVYAAIFITIGFRILRPVLNIITLPLNLVSFGLFHILTLTFTVFLVTLIYPPFQISAFTFTGLSFSGIIIQQFYVGNLLSYILISVTIYVINRAISWLFDL